MTVVLFCRVPFLSKNGFECPAFHNPSEWLSPILINLYSKYFLNYSVDYFMDVCSGGNNEEIRKLASSMQAESYLKRDAALPASSGYQDSSRSGGNDRRARQKQRPIKIEFATSFWKQFFVLLKRSMTMSIRDKMLTQMRIGSHVLVAVLVAMLYYDIGNDAHKLELNEGYLFFIILFTMFASMMPTVSKKLTFYLKLL